MEEQIRPVNARGNVELDTLKRSGIKVPSSVLPWASTCDCVVKMDDVISRTGIYNATFRPEEKELVLIGEKKGVDKAGILVSFIIDHQKDLAQIEHENKKMVKNIESKKSKIKGESVEEVLVPKELLGIIIGKAGANIAFVKQKYGVNIHIIEGEDEDVNEYTNTEIPEDKALIRLFGNEKSWVKEAKSYICLSKNSYPIEGKKVDYFKGYQNAIVNDMKEKSGCVRVFVHDPVKGSSQGVIEAIGNEESLENLRLLMETHMSYYDTYQEKETERVELSKQEGKYNSYGEVFYHSDTHNQPNRRRPRRGNKDY